MKSTKPPSDPKASDRKTSGPRASGPRLADLLCFAIYSANLAYGRAYKPILEQLGLTYTQYIAIVSLWEEDNQTVSGLGQKLFLESNTLTPILKKLETMGYLRRQRDPADERQVRVSLTDAGRNILARSTCLGETLIERSGMTPQQLDALNKQVRRLRDALVA